MRWKKIDFIGTPFHCETDFRISPDNPDIPSGRLPDKALHRLLSPRAP